MLHTWKNKQTTPHYLSIKYGSAVWIWFFSPPENEIIWHFVLLILLISWTLYSLTLHSFNPRHRFRAFMSWIYTRKCRKYYISTKKMNEGLTRSHMKQRISFTQIMPESTMRCTAKPLAGSLPSSTLDEQEKTGIAGGHASAGKNFTAIFKEMQRHKLRLELCWTKFLHLIVYTFLHICQQRVIFTVYWKCDQC